MFRKNAGDGATAVCDVCLDLFLVMIIRPVAAAASTGSITTSRSFYFLVLSARSVSYRWPALRLAIAPFISKALSSFLQWPPTIGQRQHTASRHKHNSLE